MTGERKTELDKDALEKAMAAGVMTMWLQSLGVNGRAIDRPDLERLCTDIILAYLTALPQSALSTRLLKMADHMSAAARTLDRQMIGGEVSMVNERTYASAIACYRQQSKDLREAAAALGGIPEGWVLVPRERTPEINAVLGSYRCGYDYGTGEEVWAALLAAAVPPLTPGEQK